MKFNMTIIKIYLIKTCKLLFLTIFSLNIVLRLLVFFHLLNISTYIIKKLLQVTHNICLNKIIFNNIRKHIGKRKKIYVVIIIFFKFYIVIVIFLRKDFQPI